MENLGTDIDRPAELGVDESEQLSDLELLSSALQDALDAHAAGVLVGPAVDEVGWESAARRARRADAARKLRTVPTATNVDVDALRTAVDGLLADGEVHARVELEQLLAGRVAGDAA